MQILNFKLRFPPKYHSHATCLFIIGHDTSCLFLIGHDISSLFLIGQATTCLYSYWKWYSIFIPNYCNTPSSFLLVM